MKGKMLGGADRMSIFEYQQSSFVAKSSPVSLLLLLLCYYNSHVLRGLTAGSAKKEIPIRAQKEAMSFPIHVSGVMSPYPTVQSVIWNMKKSGDARMKDKLKACLCHTHHHFCHKSSHFSPTAFFRLHLDD